LEGNRYYVANREGRGSAAYLPDDRTLINGPEWAVRKSIAAGGPRLPKLIRKEGIWERFRSDEFVVVADRGEWEAALRTLPSINGHQVDPSLPEFGFLAPLWKLPTATLFGARIGPKVVLHTESLIHDEHQAKEVEATYQALRILALNWFNQSRPTFAEQGNMVVPVDETAESKEIRKRWSDSLRQFTIVRDAGIVRASLSFDFDVLGMTTGLKNHIAARHLETTTNHLKLLAMGLRAYYDVHKRYPPAVLNGPDGKTPYSWRVALLPFLGHADLHEQYRRDEPWDSPNNRRLLAKIPSEYRSPRISAGPTHTSYFVLTGPATIFDGGPGTRLEEITDGTSSTILVVEAQRDIPWTKPEDVPYDARQPLPTLLGFAFADGQVVHIGKWLKDADLRAIITKSGGERVQLPQPLP